MVTTNIYFVMVGWNPNTEQNVYWGGWSPEYPDFAGAFSGFQGILENIQISYQLDPTNEDFNTPTGPACGDLSGDYPCPMVVGIDGYAIVNEPAPGQTLVYNFTTDGYVQWQTPSSGGGGITALTGDVTASGTGSVSATVAKLQGVVLSGSPSSGQVLTSTSSTAAHWATPSSGFTASGDLSGSSSAQEVVGITNIPLSGSPTPGQILTYNGTNLVWTAPPVAGPNFSPVTWMETVSAEVVGMGNDIFILGSGDDTVGTGFYIYDAVNTHTCTGVRFYWVGGAGKNVPIKCSLWIYGQTGTSTVARAATVTVNVTTSPGEYIGTFASAVTLMPGTAYSVSIYDTTGTNYSAIGVLGNTDSILGRSLNCSTLLANSFLMYAMPYNGGGTQSPWSIYEASDAGPQSIGLNFFPVEPVLT